MQQKTDGRVVRLLTKHLGAEDRALEQWFLVAVGDDAKAAQAVAMPPRQRMKSSRSSVTFPHPFLQAGV